jgi:hypothetical protein
VIRNHAKLRRQVVTAVRARDLSRCTAAPRVPEVLCQGPLDVHERIPRSAWPGGDLVIDNCILVCRAHHDWIDDNPKLAHDLHLHGYSWEIPR